jgi:hypothetical protein
VPKAGIQSVTDVRYGQLVTHPKAADLHPLTVDPDAVGTPQVSNHQLTIVGHHATMMTRDAE